MTDPIDDLAARWQTSQDVDSTIRLCDALSAVRTTLVQQVADFAQVKFASNVPVLVAVARMYMRSNKHAEAQSVLVAAGKIAPRDGLVYRVLGEVLLRRGDADRAEKVFERAVQFGLNDEETKTWLERARVFKPMQGKAGSRAVAAEIARTAPVAPDKAAPRNMRDFDEDETAVRSPSVPHPPAQNNGGLAPRDRKYPMNAPTIDPFSLSPSSPIPSPAKRVVPPPMPAPEPPRAAPPPMPAPAPRAIEARSAPVAPMPDVKVAHDESRSPFRAAANPGVPDARDVLDALQLAGIYESGSDGAPMKWDRATRTRRRGTLPLVAITLLFVGGGIGGFRYVKMKRDQAHVQAEAMLGTIESDMHKSQASLLPTMEQQFSQVFDLDSRSERVALDWLHERALSGLLKGGGDVAFEDGLTRARELKISEDRLVFANIASFLFQGDTVGAAALISKADAHCKDDAWYQLLAGATLERAGSSGAKDRYEAASKLDPELVIAQVGLVRSTAIDGDPVKAMELAKAFKAKYPDRAEGPALVALAWARDPARGDQAPPEVAECVAKAGDLPSALKFVPNAVLALQAIDKHDPETAKTEVHKGLAVVEGPGPASWFGLIALSTGDEALAQKAALSAVAFSAVYPPARVLAARVALLGNRLDEALKATEDLDATSPDVAVVRAATAYERVDATGLNGALEAIPQEARGFPFLEGLNVAQTSLIFSANSPLVGKTKLDAEKLLDMSDDEAPWADLVAMDLALDGGDVATASKIADKWKGTEGRPLRALRLSRLARWQNRLDDADRLSDTALIGTITPRSLFERVLVLVARDKPGMASQLLARYPLVLGSLAGWLSGYVSASSGKIEDARGKTSSLEPPPVSAPITAREIAAVSLGAMKDRRRGPDYVKELFASGALNPDIAAAAVAVGVKVPERPVERPHR
jgi:predicted Zn-dependent protease